MKLNMARELKNLKGMTVRGLREKYLEVFGEETRSGSKDFLWKRIAWRLQANAYGDLSERARARADELADDADLRVRAPKGAFDPAPVPAPERTVTRKLAPSNGRRLPMPGTILTREYRGETIQVAVRDEGFGDRGRILTFDITVGPWYSFDHEQVDEDRVFKESGRGSRQATWSFTPSAS